MSDLIFTGSILYSFCIVTFYITLKMTGELKKCLYLFQHSRENNYIIKPSQKLHFSLAIGYQALLIFATLLVYIF